MIADKVIGSLAGLLNFVFYFGTSAAFLVVFSFIYTKVTPYKEFSLISDGNLAAAYSFSGSLLGFALPLASAVSHSVNLFDMVVWGIVALIVQILAFLMVRRIFPSIVLDIPENQVSKGLFLGVISLTVGIINAACITY